MNTSRDVHQAMLSLHRVAGTVRAIPASVAPTKLGDALRTVAQSSDKELSKATKINVLGALVNARLPGFDKHKAAYHDLAAAIGGDYGLSAGQLITDLEAVDKGAELLSTQSGRTLPHEVIAFFMEDLCETAEVVVNSLDAVWVFSEFETDASFDQVAEWVDPHNWPERSPTMFKGMTPIGGTTSVPSPDPVTQWHGTFLETVQLVDRLETELYCDYYRMGDLFAGMTYSLARSRDGEIDVDRGFLLVNELGGSRHVKALKIVGFVNDVWEDVAQWVCPLWTDFIRGAVRGGSRSGGRPPSSRPGSIADAIEQWSAFAADSATEYVGLATNWARRLASGSYRADDMVRDGARFWLQVYRDLANGAALGYTTLEQLAAEPGTVPTSSPPPTLRGGGISSIPGLRSAAVALVPTPPAARLPPGGVEGTTLPLPDFDSKNGVKPTDLTRIGAPKPAIPAKLVRVSPVPLSDDMVGIRIEADVSSVQEGLYVGGVTDATGKSAPIQLYVSRAVARSPK